MAAMGQIRLPSAGTRQLRQCVSPFGKKASYVNRAQFLISRASSSKEAELKKMQEYKENVSKNLEKAASAGPSAAANDASEDTRDLPEVKLDEYWPAVENLSAGDQVLVMDFFTQWCGPCKLIKPTLCDWAEEFDGKVSFRKFEASKENAPVGKQLQIKSVPTFVVYKGGEEFGRVTGKQEEKLRAMILEAIGE